VCCWACLKAALLHTKIIIFFLPQTEQLTANPASLQKAGRVDIAIKKTRMEIFLKKKGLKPSKKDSLSFQNPRPKGQGN